MDKKSVTDDFRLRVLIGLLAIPKFLMDNALEKIRANPDKTFQDTLLNKYVNKIQDVKIDTITTKKKRKDTYIYKEISRC